MSLLGPVMGSALSPFSLGRVGGCTPHWGIIGLAVAPTGPWARYNDGAWSVVCWILVVELRFFPIRSGWV